MSFAPGGPLSFLGIANPQETSGATVAELESKFGLSDPWYVQYGRWLIGTDILFKLPQDETEVSQAATLEEGETAATTSTSRSSNSVQGCSVLATQRKGILRGDFGCSFKWRRPVFDLIMERVPATMELGIATLVVALLLGVPLGLIAAITRGSWFDNFTRIFAVVGNAVPSFWMGLILLLVFAFTLDLLPSGGRCERMRVRMEDGSSGGCADVIPIYDRLEYLVLPVFVLALSGIAGYSRYMRTAMLDTINSDYVRTARAKGLPARTVWIQHAARNALIPLATFLGPAIVGVLSGAAITETIFSWPGLGRLIVEAVTTRDYPVIMASVIVSAVLTIFAYIISDVLYAVFDPRIRF
ncbi:ABC transporter permease [Phototrophicus methaneseepsis]|uniref:ABC transporter permease n=1 Tax=Phototrophicus methaneseepsis TaxID=2710758 RepID=A0A7S8IDP6_9CHLR|nr:ABC transporter permease [Phototrophicus methaneseepsis]QPC81028.1 ABC transporter permease [Phototrophicus methaneseepsis]